MNRNFDICHLFFIVYTCSLQNILKIYSVFTMDWGDKENRVAVIALHKCGFEKSAIFKTLQPLGISRMFVYRAVKLFEETGGIDDRPRSGRPRTVRTPQAIKAVEARIRRNPLRKQKIMSREMQISRLSMSRIIREDLGLGAYKRHTGHLLTVDLKNKRKQKSKDLLIRYAGGKHRQILFTDEKIFNVEEHYNKQNDKVYARSSKEASQVVPRIQKGHHPASVMVWWGVSYEGVTNIHFCEKGVKTSALVYQNTVLDSIVKPLNTTLFKNKEWSFQQDSAPGHKAKTTQKWLQDNVRDFIKAEDWPSGSPDLNPLDYKLWSVLEGMVCSKRHPNLESLKKSLTKAVANFPMDVVRTAIDDWPVRLRACVKANGGHFE